MHTTADQEQYRQVLGPRLGPIYHGLFNEVIWLTAKWLEYKKLFAVSPERIDLLNGTSSFFFGVVQEVLWNDILLHLTRITDPPKSAGKQNLSIQQLLLAISDRKLREELEQLVLDAESKCKFARVWRNKQLAHTDLDIVLEREV